MADVTWPADYLKPKDVALCLMAPSTGGGRSIAGIEQVLQPDAARWDITFREVWLHTPDDVLRWRELEVLIQGRGNTVLVPVHDGKRAPWPGGVPGAAITATSFGVIARRSINAFATVTAGAALEAGMHFSAGERLYRIRTIESVVGNLYGVTFMPPARDEIASGTTLEFRRPVCRCRLATDDQMDTLLDLQKFAKPSVRFVEDA